MFIKKDNHIDKALLGAFPYEITACYGIEDDKQKTIAIGVLGRNPYHIYHDYIKIVVSQEHRRQGLASALFTRMKQDVMRPLQCAVDADAYPAVQFMRKQRFRRLRRCWEYEVDVADIQLNEQYPLTCLAQCTPEQITQVQEAAYQQYWQAHLSVSAMSQTITQQEWQTILYQDVDTTLSSLYVKDKQFVYMLVTLEDDLPFVMYVGGQADDKSMQAVFQAQLAHLAKSYDTILFEIDDTDKPAMLLKALLRADEPVAYETYVY